MKTTILISSLSALILVIALADSPGSHTLKNNNSLVNPLPVNNSPLSTGTETIRDMSRISAVEPATVLATEDFSYLKFNVTDFMENDDEPSAEPEELPVSPAPDYSYLKFDVNRFIGSGKEHTSSIGELPIPETEPSLTLQ
jgi:hypothetical protein